MLEEFQSPQIGETYKKCQYWHICILCPSRSEGHKCDIGACKSCDAMHNILLYPKEKYEDHKVMGATDTSNHDDDSDNDHQTGMKITIFHY